MGRALKQKMVCEEESNLGVLLGNLVRFSKNGAQADLVFTGGDSVDWEKGMLSDDYFYRLRMGGYSVKNCYLPSETGIVYAGVTPSINHIAGTPFMPFMTFPEIDLDVWEKGLEENYRIYRKPGSRFGVLGRTFFYEDTPLIATNTKGFGLERRTKLDFPNFPDDKDDKVEYLLQVLESVKPFKKPRL